MFLLSDADSLCPHDQEVLALHNDVPEYEARLVKAGANILHAQFAILAKQFIGGGDQIADIGVGLGTISRILVGNGHYARRIANDISKPYLTYVESQGLYDETWLGTAETFLKKLAADKRKVDWLTLISVTYYFEPKRLAAILMAARKVCRKGVILTIDAIPEELQDRWRNDTDRPLTVYNHRNNWRPHEAGFASLERFWSDIGWSSSLTGIEVPVDLIILRV